MNNSQQISQSSSSAKPASILGKIKLNEKKANEQIKQAQNQAGVLIAQAKTQARQIIDQARRLNQDEIGNILNQAKNKIKERQNQAKNQIAAEIKKLEQIPEEKTNQAANLAVASLMNF